MLADVGRGARRASGAWGGALVLLPLPPRTETAPERTEGNT